MEFTAPVKTIENRNLNSNPDNDMNPDAEQFSENALSCEWLESFWPTIQITLNAAIGIFSALIQLTIDLLGSVAFTSCNLGVTGIDFDDPNTAQRVALVTERAAISTAKTGLILATWTLGLLISSYCALNPGALVIFLVVLAMWEYVFYNHIQAFITNLANGYTTVSDAISSILTQTIGFISLLCGFAFKVGGKTLDCVVKVIEKLFGKINEKCAVVVKWILIFNALFWIGYTLYTCYHIQQSQGMDSIFIAPNQQI